MKLFITAVRPSTATTHKGITGYRWLKPDDGTAGTADLAGMIVWLDKKDNEAFVAGSRGPAEVTVVDEAPNRYPRTTGDGEDDNNLENLPKF
jgi:hypothetical protein